MAKNKALNLKLNLDEKLNFQNEIEYSPIIDIQDNSFIRNFHQNNDLNKISDKNINIDLKSNVSKLDEKIYTNLSIQKNEVKEINDDLNTYIIIHEEKFTLYEILKQYIYRIEEKCNLIFV